MSPSPGPILVVGGSGLLGRELTRQGRLAGHRVVATFHRGAPAVAGVDWRHLDIRIRDDVTALILAVRPDVVVNAAYQQSDWATTADGGTHVALAAAAVSARLVHVSSDAVFSGTADSYDESHTNTQARLVTRLRGAREFLIPTPR
ncbi:hypothetical protein GCM10022251_46720 [Phytohabitans flavus]|uniref:RmlD-like substrate binding domain-containing protein n=1 Tax=Phytohabitans flavus TaxID=1076124 RepID=A0A6F8Y893_9ACTN|nr:hypothetical protein Pflav_086530 [Phytohabitans flavus]